MTAFREGDRIILSGVVVPHPAQQFRSTRVRLDGVQAPGDENFIVPEAMALAKVERAIVAGDRVRYLNTTHPANTYTIVAIDGSDAFVRYDKNGEHFVLKDFDRKVERI